MYINSLTRIGHCYGEEEFEKRLKNYFRVKLRACTDKPVVLSGKFKKIYDKHITLTTIRPYIKGIRTLTICSHINLYRPDVEKVYDIANFEKNRKYYFIGYCLPYPHSARMGIKLADNIGIRPIFTPAELPSISDNVFESCHQFNVEEFLRGSPLPHEKEGIDEENNHSQECTVATSA